jgi:hypothetical protein
MNSQPSSRHARASTTPADLSPELQEHVEKRSDIIRTPVLNDLEQGKNKARD